MLTDDEHKKTMAEVVRDRVTWINDNLMADYVRFTGTGNTKSAHKTMMEIVRHMLNLYLLPHHEALVADDAVQTKTIPVAERGSDEAPVVTTALEAEPTVVEPVIVPAATMPTVVPVTPEIVANPIVVEPEEPVVSPVAVVEPSVSVDETPPSADTDNDAGTDGDDTGETDTSTAPKKRGGNKKKMLLE